MVSRILWGLRVQGLWGFRFSLGWGINLNACAGTWGAAYAATILPRIWRQGRGAAVFVRSGGGQTWPFELLAFLATSLKLENVYPNVQA